MKLEDLAKKKNESALFRGFATLLLQWDLPHLKRYNKIVRRKYGAHALKTNTGYSRFTNLFVTVIYRTVQRTNIIAIPNYP